MENLENKRKQQLINKRIANSLVMLVGIIFILLLTTNMQKSYSISRYENTSRNALESITENMEINSEMVDQLVERYHKNNQAIIDDFVTLFRTGRYHLLYEAEEDKRCEIMRILSDAIGNKGYLFVINKNGEVILSPFKEYLGVNLVDKGTFENAEFSQLIDKNLSPDKNYAIGKINDTNNGYFYSDNLINDYYLVYGLECVELENQYSGLRNLGPILSNVVIGETGFVFAVDLDNGSFKYFNNNENILTGESIKECGLSDAILTDGYSGVETINGVSYNVYTRTCNSKLYGNISIVTACVNSEVHSNDPITNAVITMVFLISTAICLFYAYTLQTDPDELVYYDEEVKTIKEVRKNNLFNFELKQIVKNVKVFDLNEEPVYFKGGVASALGPVILICLLLIFTVSFNGQTMVELSKGLTESNGAVIQIQKVFDDSEKSSKLLMEHYQNQYLSKIRIISYIVEEEPSIIFNSDNGYGQSVNSLYKYIDDDYNSIINADGIVLESVARSSALQKLADINGFDNLFIFDDHGHTVATNSNLWYFVLSEDAEDQSNEFTKLITGELDSLIQKPQIDDNGEYKQYVGVPLLYYTYKGEGELNGNYASEADYTNFVNNEDVIYDGVKYEIIDHTGIMQGSISDKTISSIMDSTDPENLLNSFKVDTNGFVTLFDNSEDHVCVWSPHSSNIGKSSSELGISDNAFSGIHKGLNKINGIEYFQTFNFINGYWVATSIPSSDLFVGRATISLITLFVSFVFFLFMFVSCVFTSDTEEKDLVKLVERRIMVSDDNGMVKLVMSNGREKYARTATARFTNTTYKWANMLPFQKLDVVFKVVLGVFVFAALICIVSPERIFGADSLMYYIVHGDWEHSFNYFAFVSFIGTLIIVFAITSILSWIIRLIISNMGTRIETIGRLALSVLKYGSVLFSIFYGLSLLGVSTASLVTSASIMSIVIGLGSQSLISDILAGIFIVFEGSFRVGDIVSLDGFSGTVVDIGLRTTKIEDSLRNIKIFNNSSIKSILNMTKKASVIKIDLNISYTEDLYTVEDLLRKSCKKLGKKVVGLLNIPEYIGVSGLLGEYITLTIVANCAEQDRSALTMKLTRELYLILKENNISCQYNKL